MNRKYCRNKLILVWILWISLYSAGIISAEQNQTSRFLTTEPLTLMDLGIYRLNQLMNEDPFGTATVKYDRKRDKIHIRVAISERDVDDTPGAGITDKRQAYGLVRQVVNSIRDKLGINPKTGEIVSGETSFEACFKPVAERDKKTKPKNLKKELFNLTDISVHFSHKNIKIVSSAQLKGTEISFDR